MLNVILVICVCVAGVSTYQMMKKPRDYIDQELGDTDEKYIIERMKAIKIKRGGSRINRTRKNYADHYFESSCAIVVLNKSKTICGHACKLPENAYHVTEIVQGKRLVFPHF